MNRLHFPSLYRIVRKTATYPFGLDDFVKIWLDDSIYGHDLKIVDIIAHVPAFAQIPRGVEQVSR